MFALAIGVAEFIECVEVIAILLKRRPSEACGIDQANRGEDRDLKYLDSDSVREGRGADGNSDFRRGAGGAKYIILSNSMAGGHWTGRTIVDLFSRADLLRCGLSPPPSASPFHPPPLPYHTPSLHHTMNPPYLLITCNQHGKGLACSG